MFFVFFDDFLGSEDQRILYVIFLNLFLVFTLE